MTTSPRLARILVIGCAAIALIAALIVGLMWWHSSRQTTGDAPTDGVDASARAGAESSNVGFRTRLLPDGGVSASPSSVRIGLASVSPDDDAAYRAWKQGGQEGAGPRVYADLATVVRWVNAPAALQADGSVLVGPMSLPSAQRYVLQARADDGLRFYEAAFERANAPAELRARVAAGLRVRAPSGTNGMGMLFRRVEGSQDAAWQSLLRREAVAVLDAFDERAMSVATDTSIAPLPPGPLDIVAVVNGVETERRRITLIAGRYLTLDLDPEASELGAALSTAVALRLIEAGSGAPVRDALAVWPSPRGETRVRSDAAGIVRLQGVDTSEQMQLELRFEPKGPPSFLVDALPRWPERIPLNIDLSDARIVGGVAEKTVELQPLRWLIVETQGIEVPRRPRVEDPFPVFVLQRAQGTAWRDSNADYFRPVDEGMAVSLDAPGRVRVAALLSPWQVAYSESIEARAGVFQERVRVRREGGRTVAVNLVADARPLAFASVQVVSPLRGVPPKTLTTDARGRILLPNATMPAVRFEVAGFDQIEVRLDRDQTTISLRRGDG